MSIGEAIETVRQIASEEAPAGFAYDYAGASRQFVQEGNALWVTFALALAIIYLVLAGLVTLIGLISKHGILIVEFANRLRRDKGLSVGREAVEGAAAICLRPVLMTTAAMVFGMVPLVLATGPGAVSRFDTGLVIATGISVGTLFTLFVLRCVCTRCWRGRLTRRVSSEAPRASKSHFRCPHKNST